MLDSPPSLIKCQYWPPLHTQRSTEYHPSCFLWFCNTTGPICHRSCTVSDTNPSPLPKTPDCTLNLFSSCESPPIPPFLLHLHHFPPLLNSTLPSIRLPHDSPTGQDQTVNFQKSLRNPDSDDLVSARQPSHVPLWSLPVHLLLPFRQLPLCSFSFSSPAPLILCHLQRWYRPKNRR